MDVRESISAVKTAVEEGANRPHSEELIKASRAVVSFIGGFLLSAAMVLGTGSPFGIAAVAAAGAGLSGLCCLLGTSLGYIVFCGLGSGIRCIAASMLVFTVLFAFQETRLYAKTAFAPLTAGVCCCLTGFLAAFTDMISGTPTAAVILLESTLAAGGCWFFREAMCDEERTTESSELRHSASVLITLAVLLMALSRLEIPGAVSMGRFLALLMVLTATLRCGMLVGCTVGTVFGLCMDLAVGGLPFYTMSYALGGLLSGVFNRHGRLVFLLSFILACAVAVICTWSTQPQINALLEVFCACVVFMVLPSGFLCKVGSLIEPSSDGSGESGLRHYVAKRVEGLSRAYSGLYDIVRRNVEKPVNDNDPSHVFDRAAEAVCVNCREKNRCWNNCYVDTLSALNDASEIMLKRGMLCLEDIPRHFTERCRTPEAFVAAVNGELRAAAYRRQFAASLRDSRDTAWGQYADMAEVLTDVAGELDSVNGADRLAERRLSRYLRTMDIEADTAVYRDGSGRLRAVIESANLAPLFKNESYLEKLSEVLGTRMCRPETAAEGTARLVLAEAEPLAVKVGIAAMKKEGERISGDRGACFKTDSGVLCVILSDGMGCGDDAAKESGEVIEILEGFLRSGMDPAVAMKTLNSVMLLKSADHWGFATVDLMCIDMFTGETCFYKYGAAPSYVMNGKSIQRIKCETLAPGLTGAGVAPDVVRMRLRPGSTAIIASDGVIGDNNDGWLREVLDSATDDMKLLARDTLREAERVYGNADDMTVLAVRVEKRT